MAAARRSRLYALLGVSLLAHAGVLAVLGLREPRLNLAPAPPVMEVQVVPYYVLSTPRAPEAERLPPLAERPIRPRQDHRRQHHVRRDREEGTLGEGDRRQGFGGVP